MNIKYLLYYILYMYMYIFVYIYIYIVIQLPRWLADGYMCMRKIVKHDADINSCEKLLNMMH